MKSVRENRKLQGVWHDLTSLIAIETRYMRCEIQRAVWNLTYRTLPHHHVQLNFALVMRDISCGITSSFDDRPILHRSQHVNNGEDPLTRQPNDHLGIILGMFSRQDVAKLQCVCIRFRDFITRRIVERDSIVFIKLEEAVYTRASFFRMNKIHLLLHRKCPSYCHFIDGHSLYMIAFDRLRELHVGSILVRGELHVSMPQLRKLTCSESALRWIVAPNLTVLVLKGRSVRDNKNTTRYVLAFAQLVRAHFEPGISTELMDELISRGILLV